MTDTWQRVIGALLLIVSMGTATCSALWHVRTSLPEHNAAETRVEP